MRTGTRASRASPGTNRTPAPGAVWTSAQYGSVRILVAALGSPGHAFPLVPLARALHDAGHDVVFATGPDVVSTIATAGLPTTPSGRPVFDVFREAMIGRGITERRPTEEDDAATSRARCSGTSCRGWSPPT